MSGGERGGSGPPTARTIAARGVRLAAESFGRPGDPAVLLIMGAMASAVWWPEESCRRLAARGRFVIRYDQRDPLTPMNHAQLSGGERWYGCHELHPADWPAILDAIAGHTGSAGYSNDPGA